MNRKRVLAHSTDFPGRTHHRQGSCSTCSEKSPGRRGISSDLSADRWCPSSVCLPYPALSRELEDDVRIELNPSCNGQSAFEAVPTPGRFIIHGARGRIRTPKSLAPYQQRVLIPQHAHEYPPLNKLGLIARGSVSNPSFIYISLRDVLAGLKSRS